MNVIKITSSLLLICTLPYCTVQKEMPFNAYSDANETIIYADSICYSRGIAVNKNELITANSNGKIYRYDLKSKKKQEYLLNADLEELRDISVTKNCIYALQSGSTGKLIEISKRKKTRIIEYDFWKGVFLDGMDFFGKTGFMMGDPLNEQFSLYHSKDAGKNWTVCEGKITAQKGEAGYAASGTNVQVLNDSTYLFISGGSINRLHRSSDSGKTWTSTIVPFNTGEGIGAFSICFKNQLEGIAVGGDYQKPLIKEKTIFKTIDGGLTWTEIRSGNRGFRSCVYLKNEIYYACGTNGIDYSKDGGQTWFNLINGNFFAITSDDDFLYATCPKSTVLKIKLIK
jgi:photosystem II stability/assembly factor-like uncharacterized protein